MIDRWTPPGYRHRAELLPAQEQLETPRQPRLHSNPEKQRNKTGLWLFLKPVVEDYLLHVINDLQDALTCNSLLGEEEQKQTFPNYQANS